MNAKTHTHGKKSKKKMHFNSLEMQNAVYPSVSIDTCTCSIYCVITLLIHVVLKYLYCFMYKGGSDSSIIGVILRQIDMIGC